MQAYVWWWILAAVLVGVELTSGTFYLLVYLLLADRDIEIVADRGIAACVAPALWEQVAQTMEAAFRQGEFERGALAGIEMIGALLAAHFPPTGNNPDELANRPVILRR